MVKRTSFGFPDLPDTDTVSTFDDASSSYHDDDFHRDEEFGLQAALEFAGNARGLPVHPFPRENSAGVYIPPSWSQSSQAKRESVYDIDSIHYSIKSIQRQYRRDKRNSAGWRQSMSFASRENVSIGDALAPPSTPYAASKRSMSDMIVSLLIGTAMVISLSARSY